MTHFDSLKEFEKDFKKLSKKYPRLNQDLDNLKKVLDKYPLGIGNNFTILTSVNSMKIIKMRLACRDLKNNSLRLIYAYVESIKKIIFIEIYDKGQKENEDSNRIKNFLKQC